VLRTGNWLNAKKSLDLSKEELFDAYLGLIARYYEEGAPIALNIQRVFMCRKGGKDYVLPFKKQGDESGPLCSDTRDFPYIAADGKLLPCFALSGRPIHEKMPSLNEINLERALSDSPYAEWSDTPVSAFIEHNPECASCEHRKACGGGCRAAALSFNDNNDYLGRDPLACVLFMAGCEDMIHRAAAPYARPKS
jgi:radical SAM protein with 4Fe4S-binding SPASM domain